MKSKPALLITATIIIMFAVILIAANHLEDVKDEEEIVREESLEVINIQQEVTGLNRRLSNLEHHLPEIEVEKSLEAINRELDQVKELLRWMPNLKTLYGRILDYHIGEELVLEIETNEEREMIQVSLDENRTVYLITEVSWASITSKEFIEFLEESLDLNNEVFTLKLIEGKAVQVYQGKKLD